MSIRDRQRIMLEKGAERATKWIGSPASVTTHTIIFLVSFVLPYLGVVTFERMLLFLTTMVSLEAIYLSIFIQMSINMNNQNIEIIQEDIEELGEEIEELGEDIEEISGDIEELGEDIEEMQKDVEEISEDIEELGEDIEEMQKDVEEISEEIEELGEDIEEMQKDKDVDETQQEEVEMHREAKDGRINDKKDTEILQSIQATLAHLQQEIELLKKSKGQ